MKGPTVPSEAQFSMSAFTTRYLAFCHSRIGYPGCSIQGKTLGYFDPWPSHIFCPGTGRRPRVQATKTEFPLPVSYHFGKTCCVSQLSLTYCLILWGPLMLTKVWGLWSQTQVPAACTSHLSRQWSTPFSVARLASNTLHSLDLFAILLLQLPQCQNYKQETSALARRHLIILFYLSLFYFILFYRETKFWGKWTNVCGEKAWIYTVRKWKLANL